MAISWDSIRALTIFLGPIIIPKALSLWRSTRSAPTRHGLSIRPAPPRMRAAILSLSFLAFVLACMTLPVFSPENVFISTQSRLQIPVDVLFARIAALRPDKNLTEADVSLRNRFVNLESRLLYLQFGPEPLSQCSFCGADEPRSYLFYALPTLLWPHVGNLAALAVVTSPSWTGRHGARWRGIAVVAAVLLAALEVYAVATYNYKANARALRLDDVHFFHWTARNTRLLLLAGLDGLLAAAVWLSATNRAFVQLPNPEERIEAANRVVLAARSKLNALGIVKNTAARDEALRARGQAYWLHEVRLMAEVMEEREVIEGVNDALGNRIDIQSITKDAEQYTEGVLRPLGQ